MVYGIAKNAPKDSNELKPKQGVCCVDDAKFILSKLELYNICHVEENVKDFL